MPVPRRLWDSSVVVGYLAGYESLKPNCPQIISQAQRGELEIIVSTIATIEAAYLQGHSDEDSEDRIIVYRSSLVGITSFQWRSTRA